MDEQTRKLLEECCSGCRMAIESFRQVQEYVRRRFPATDYALFRLIYVDGPRGGRRPATWGAACTP